MCPRLSAIIITVDMRMLRLINVSQLSRRTRASLTLLTECTRAKKTLIFLLDKTAPSATQSKHVQVMLISMVNVSHEKVVTSTFMKAAKETNAYMTTNVIVGPCFCLSKTRATDSAFLSTSV